MPGYRFLGMPTPAVIGAVVVILVIGGLAYVELGSRSSSDEWGPMAVTSDGNGDMARTEGVLRIADKCVRLEQTNDTSAILVWSEHQVTWDAANRQILFRNRDDTVVGLRDGQPLVAGGSGESLSESGTSAESRSWDEFLALLHWVAEPNPTCPVDSYWFVGDAQLVSAE